MKSFALLAAIVLSVLLVETELSPPVLAATVVVSPDKPTGVYAIGETIHWTAQWLAPEPPPTDAKYTIKAGGAQVTSTGDLKFEGNTAHFESKLDAANTVLAVVSWGPADAAHTAVGGAVADPANIRPSAPEPSDFDAFWTSKLAELRKIPPNAVLTPADSNKPGVTYAKLTLDNVGSTHVQGQIARPAKGDKFPAILIPQWAGVYGLQKSWVTDRAADGWLAINLESHDIPIDESPKFYADLYAPGGALHNYWKIHNDDRDQSYYLRMYLGNCQALEYLMTRPDWDGKTIVIMGTSQGGQQTLVVAGLYPGKVTAALPLVPAACDAQAPSMNRAGSFPNWWAQVDAGQDPAKVRETGKYFDPVYFAARIRCPVLLGLGLRDEVCPPATIFAAANQISAPTELIILPTSGHQDENGSQAPYQKRVYSAWLPALLHGEAPPVAK